MACLFVSTGCPAGIGPEVSVVAAARFHAAPVVLVGDRDTLLTAAERCRVATGRFKTYDKSAKPKRGEVYIYESGPKLGRADRRPGKPSRNSGQAQLAYLADAYRLTQALKAAGAALVTGPVNKAAIARSGAHGAAHFRGHTEWLGAADGAVQTVMCFASPKLVTSLVTTHLPLSHVSRNLTPRGVGDAAVALARLLHALGRATPKIAVCSLNPHAGEDEMFGKEEALAIVPGLRRARRALRGTAELVGPIGAETAYRRTVKGAYDGVVAMYHDQATIPLKVLAFGDAVNVTMGLSIVRTSVDHGTAYDIAGQGVADATGMLAALNLAMKLTRGGAAGKVWGRQRK